MKEFENSSLSDFKYTRWHETLEFSKEGKASSGNKNVFITPDVLENENIIKSKQKSLEIQNENINVSDENKASESEKTDASSDEKDNKNIYELKSPLAGVFYRSPKPGEKPYVEIGQDVKTGETVGLIEAMKMISEIPSPCDGKILSIELSDGEFAEYDKVLMKIEKA